MMSELIQQLLSSQIRFFNSWKQRIQKMFIRSTESLVIAIVAAFSLVLQVESVSWQGTGNMTQSNLTDIWGAIRTNINTYVGANTNLAGFSTFLSNTYNSLWNPAWNVFVIELFDPTLDAIVVGYAFREHWMWFNNYIFSSRSFSFVIWKDSNCKTWNTVDNSMWKSSFSSSDPNYSIYQSLSAAITAVTQPVNLLPSFPYDDIWKTHYLIIDKMNALNPTSAYSIVAVQNKYSLTTDLAESMNGRFCSDGGAKSYMFGKVKSLKSSTSGNGNHKIIIIETRNI